MRKIRQILLPAGLSALLLLSSPGAAASELKPETLEAFNRYSAARDAEFDAEVQHDPFLWVDAQAESKKQNYYRQLRNRELVIERLDQRVQGKKYEVASALVHHWVGIVFVPGAKVGDVVRLVEDYDHHSKYFGPEVARSKLISRDDGHFLTYLRFHKKHILSVTVDTWHEAWYRTISPARVVSRSHVARSQEVEDEGKPDEKLLPEGDDRGFLWRLNTYWKYEEKDGGTYVQCESVTLTRDIPLLLKPIIEPFVTSVPKESLVALLNHTRQFALAGLAGPAGSETKP